MKLAHILSMSDELDVEETELFSST